MHVDTKQDKLVYWESQLSDNLCGLHCLNNVLQAPIYDEISLSEIAIDIERLESQLTGVYEVPAADQNNNVSLDGNFNVQVISKALESAAAGCRLVSTMSKSVQGRDITSFEAYICNHSHHWIGLRKVHGVWYNLNSFNSDGPQIISDFYMSVLLDSIRENGYTIFVVEGVLPVFPPENFRESTKKTQFYFKESQIRKANDKRNKEKNNEINLSGYDKRDLNKMLERARRQEQGLEPETRLGKNVEDQPEKPAEKKFFEGKGVSLSSAGSNNLRWYEGDTDPEILAVVRLSLQDVDSTHRGIPRLSPGKPQPLHLQVQTARRQAAHLEVPPDDPSPLALPLRLRSDDDPLHQLLAQLRLPPAEARRAGPEHHPARHPRHGEHHRLALAARLLIIAS